ncbi:MAG: peptidylprolyl isomerase, partial [Bacteroidales bacterium]|nr:peptidylprolyl isomerase [Bacteroidales bacterium]
MPQQQQQPADGNETLVLITTSFGDITLKLYNDTPVHRDNFIKMINE